MPVVLGEGVIVVAALGAVLLFVLGFALSNGWKRTFGLFFEIASSWAVAFSVLGKHIDLGHPLGFLGSLNRKIEAVLSEWVRLNERAIVWLLRAFVAPFLLSARVTLQLAHLLHDGITATRTEITHTVTRVVTHTVVKPITSRITVVKGLSASTFHKLTGELHALEARIAHLAHATAGAIANPIPRLGRLEREVGSQAKRLRKDEKALVGAGAAALVWVALKRLGLKWVRCSNVSRVGRFLCSDMPSSLLNSLLADAALVGGVVGLVEFAEEMGGIIEPMSEGIAFLAGVAEHAPDLPDLIP